MTTDTEKRAPVQGYPGGIPWAIHLEAYEVYCKRWGAQPALIDLEGRNCRGGFSTGELDDFIPGWRDRVAEFGLLKAEVSKLRTTADDYAVEINRLRNVVQAACTGGLDHMIERWKVLFPDAPVPSVQAAPTQAARDVLAERQRQISVEGWTLEHDDEHGRGEMARAAACYALHAAGQASEHPGISLSLESSALGVWPWDQAWHKPSDTRRNLVKAGALILAELERLDRAAA